MKHKLWLAIATVVVTASCAAQNPSVVNTSAPTDADAQKTPLSDDVRIVEVSVQLAEDFERSVSEENNGISDQRILREITDDIELSLLNANTTGSAPARAVVKITSFSFINTTLTTETVVFDSASGQRLANPVTTKTKRPVGPSVFNTFNNHLPFRSVLLVGEYAGGKIVSDLYGSSR